MEHERYQQYSKRFPQERGTIMGILDGLLGGLGDLLGGLLSAVGDILGNLL